MSKRLRNKRGKSGQNKRNTQFCKERGRVIAKHMQRIRLAELREAEQKATQDPLKGFFK